MRRGETIKMNDSKSNYKASKKDKSLPKKENTNEEDEESDYSISSPGNC